MATRRKTNEYNWRALEFDARPLPNLSRRSSPRRNKIQFIVVHHMTIVGDGKGHANTRCIETWRNREASAHYGVDGKVVAQFVWDNLAAWATATTFGNHAGISIEHANSKAGPSWEVSEDTWRTGAKLVAYLCLAYKLGRPKAGKNLRQHSDFFPTACAGPYLGKKIWKKYEAEAQRVYDAIVKGEEPTEAPTKPAKPSTDRMDPDAYFIGAKGDHVTWLGERLVAHGFDKHYKVGPGPSFSEADRKNVADFQKAQGWTGSDADGFPGPVTLTMLASAPAKNDPDPQPVDRMNPAAYFIGATGDHVTWLGERLVAHGFGKHYRVGPGPTYSEADRKNVAAFQRAQGWTGADADGFPGPHTLELLKGDPVKVRTVEVTSAILNAAGNNATGIKTAKARMKRYIAARKATPVHVINLQETTVASGIRPMLDKGLKPLGYRRTGGGKGRYCYTRGVKVIDSGLFTVPSKHWYKKDDKQAAWVAYEVDGAKGMDVSLHLEHRPGAKADKIRVQQAAWIADKALSTAKRLGVPTQNILLAGDTNSEGMVERALINKGWRNVAAGTKFERQHTFMGWNGKSRKRYDYGFAREDAEDAELVALSRNTSISDHASLRVRRQLIK